MSNGLNHGLFPSLFKLLPKEVLQNEGCTHTDLFFSNSRPSDSNFKRSLEHIFLTAGQNNFGNNTTFKRYTEELYMYWSQKSEIINE